MARPLRIAYPGAVYHVECRGNAGRSVFEDEEDRLRFLEILEEVVGRHRWRLHAYCLLPGRYRLVIETPQADLSAGMRTLNGRYTQEFNRRRGFGGHVFQGRFQGLLVEKGEPLLRVIRHVVLSPIREGLARKRKDWPWSSYNAVAGHVPCPGFLYDAWTLKRVAEPGGGSPRKAFRKVVKAGLKRGEEDFRPRASLWIGSDAFGERLRRRAGEKVRDREYTRSQRSFVRRPLGTLFPAERELSRADRDRRIAKAFLEERYSQREIGDHLGLHYSTISKIIKQAGGPGDARRRGGSG